MKLYPYAQSETVSTRQLAAHIAAHNSVFSGGTILGIVEDICHEISEMLLNGYSVNLEGIGRMYITISSDGVAKAEDYNTSMIKKLNIRFAPDASLVSTLNNAQF